MNAASLRDVGRLQRLCGHSSAGKRRFPGDKPCLTEPSGPRAQKGESSQGSGMGRTLCPQGAEGKNGGWEEHQEHNRQ